MAHPRSDGRGSVDNARYLGEREFVQKFFNHFRRCIAGCEKREDINITGGGWAFRKEIDIW